MGHRVTRHEGKCKSLHGHRYRIEVTLEGDLIQFGAEEGMVMDFGFIKDVMLAEIDIPCDHGMCLWAQDPLLHEFLRESALMQTVYEATDNGHCETNWIGGKLYVLGTVPTAENLAEHWYHRLAIGIGRHLAPENGTVYSVRVWETPNCSAIYKGTARDIEHARAIIQAGQAADDAEPF